ncbi:[Acyl-carrier-protein] S-malonyltransferase [Desulfonatronum thiosulfatophilum]|uniref:Malonyl CoA-acyl carrier protein transacylase n=1 Tax=Desulfonatronum thiosulfatophilum TaxID=617002 RepID=A0A1G6CVT0_9BACT|nr:ACP S-malonyltransferase [Desulfonatronum thiosulfatophilum]SDB36805.1 [Acyl-carrier-protein] S-malonyltransferase [Desulfonatronum thiosulfatophilum]
MNTPEVKTVVVFPGQGSQEKGMGRDVAERFTEAMDLWKQAEKAADAPLREIYWDGTDQDMARTRYLQPAMTATTLSLWIVGHQRLRADCLAGHSLGEFAALAAARILEIPDVLELTALRGRLMDEAGSAQGGKMAAVLKLSRNLVQEIIDAARGESGQELRIANDNSPGQFVISGTAELVEQATSLVKERKGRAVPLAVSGAFHSSLMAEPAREFAGVLKKMDWRSPRIPLYFNVTARPESDPARIQTLVAEQMTSSVLWTQSVLAQWQDGARNWVELGPKGVLTRLINAILADKTDSWESKSISGLEQLDTLPPSSE